MCQLRSGATRAFYLMLSPASGRVDLGSADAVFTGEASDDHAGYALPRGRIGDIDWNGHDDLLIGVPWGASGHSAYLMLGPVADQISLGSADVLFGSSWYGGTVSGAADVDADGLPDLLLWEEYNALGGSDAGTVYLVLGSSL